MMTAQTLTADEARRIAVAAQGFSGAARTPKRRPFDAPLDRLHVLQIDSVNVFARSHYLPVFSRQGEYDTERFDEHLWRSGEFTEYWAHEAAFIRVEDRPLFHWRMQRYRERYAERIASLEAEIAYVRQALADEGPQFVRDLEREPRTKRGPWWGWSKTKLAVEALFGTGEVVAAERVRFERKYALAADVLPEAALTEVPHDEAHRALVERAARSLGVGTLADLADYHRLKASDAKVAVRSLEEAGVLLPVRVEGWHAPSGAPLPAWLHRDAQMPARLAPDALLTPFDPIVWFRPRAERIFDFHYRIEIYTPKEKRQFGYYCLPLMVNGRLAGRIDLKADRKGRELLVQAAWQESKAPKRTVEAAQQLLVSAARWQGLERVRSAGVGNLALPETLDVE